MACSMSRFVKVEPSGLSSTEVGLLLGTEPIRPDGSSNFHFLSRTQAAIELYRAHKIERLVISGNPNNRGYDEPMEMKRRVVELGFPEAQISLDRNGTSTWESGKVAVRDYHIDRVILITDRFHAARALFIFRSLGIDAAAFCGKDEGLGYWMLRSELREFLARLKALPLVAFWKLHLR
jgi:SanA protein